MKTLFSVLSIGEIFSGCYGKTQWSTADVELKEEDPSKAQEPWKLKHLIVKLPNADKVIGEGDLVVGDKIEFDIDADIQFKVNAWKTDPSKKSVSLKLINYRRETPHFANPFNTPSFADTTADEAESKDKKSVLEEQTKSLKDMDIKEIIEGLNFDDED